MKAFTRKIFVFIAASIFCSMGITGVVFADKQKNNTFSYADILEIETNSVAQKDSPMVDYGLVSELGRSYTKSFVVKNTTNKKQVIKLSIPEETEGNGEFFEASKWTTFVGGKNYYELDAGATASVAMRVNVPNDAVKGSSQYAKVKFELENDLKNLAISCVKAPCPDVSGDEKTVSGEVLLKLTLDGDLNYTSEKNIGVSRFNFDQSIPVKIKMNNTGRVGYQTEVKVRFSPAFDTNNWTTVDGFDGQKYELMPSGDLDIDVNAETGAWGIYKIETTYKYVNSEGKLVTATNTQFALCCPWQLIAGIVGGIVLIIVLIVIVKKSKSKKKKSKKTEDDESEKNEEVKVREDLDENEDSTEEEG